MRKMLIVLALAVLKLAAPISAQQQDRDWYYTNDVDAFSDEDRSFVFTVDDGSNAALGFKCLADGLNVFFLLDSYMVGDRKGRVHVRYRVDRNQPKEPEAWPLQRANRSTFAVMPHKGITAFRQQVEAGRLVAFEVVDPADSESRRHSFSLDGLSAALMRLPCARAAGTEAPPPDVRRHNLSRSARITESDPR